MSLNLNKDFIRNLVFDLEDPRGAYETEFCNEVYGGQYGWFFWTWILIGAIALFLLIHFFAKKHNAKTDDKVVFFTGLALLIFEVNKEALAFTQLGHYAWNLFPFQFCSTPMWIMVIAPLLKEGKVKDAMFKFLSFFGVIAATVAIALPSGFYWTYFTMSLHSFFWHISMFVIGVYLIVAKGYCKSVKDVFKEAIPAAIVFAVLASMALVFNEVGGAIFGDQYVTLTEVTENGVKEYRKYIDGYWFNMFYVSRHYISSLPVCGDLQKAIQGLAPVSVTGATYTDIIDSSNIFGYAIFFLLYIVVFAIGGTVIWFASFGIRKLVNLIKSKVCKKA